MVVRFALSPTIVALVATLGCAASSTRLTAMAASSGPHPNVAVTLLDGVEADAPSVPLRWIRVYEAGDQGLVPTGSVRADQVVGVSGASAAPVARFRAHGNEPHA